MRPDHQRQSTRLEQNRLLRPISDTWTDRASRMQQEAISQEYVADPENRLSELWKFLPAQTSTRCRIYSKLLSNRTSHIKATNSHISPSLNQQNGVPTSTRRQGLLQLYVLFGTLLLTFHFLGWSFATGALWMLHVFRVATVFLLLLLSCKRRRHCNFIVSNPGINMYV